MVPRLKSFEKVICMRVDCLEIIFYVTCMCTNITYMRLHPLLSRYGDGNSKMSIFIEKYELIK